MLKTNLNVILVNNKKKLMQQKAHIIVIHVVLQYAMNVCKKLKNFGMILINQNNDLFLILIYSF